MSISFFGFTIIGVGQLRALQAKAASASSIQMSIPQPAGGERGDVSGKPPAAVSEVIRLADGLLDLTGNGAAPDQQQASALRWVDARAKSLLAACDVVRVEETGSFDPSRHQAVSVRTAPSPQLSGQIAETIRPGYAWRDALLRPQQVIVYAPADQALGA
jgi:GrpE